MPTYERKFDYPPIRGDLEGLREWAFQFIKSLHLADSPDNNPIGNPLEVGEDDTTVGVVKIYGGGAGDDGAESYWYLGSDDDTNIEYYHIKVVADDWFFGTSAGGVANGSFRYDRGLGEWFFREGLLGVGWNDNTNGTIEIYGDGTASTSGGEIKLFLAADHDAAYIDSFRIRVYQDDPQIGPAGNIDSISCNYTGSGGIYKWTVEDQMEFIEAVKLLEKSTDPAAPAEGEAIVWMSDGTGKGDDGDVLIASTAGGVTKWGTLFDHSGGAAW